MTLFLTGVVLFLTAFVSGISLTVIGLLLAKAYISLVWWAANITRNLTRQ